MCLTVEAMPITRHTKRPSRYNWILVQGSEWVLLYCTHFCRAKDFPVFAFWGEQVGLAKANFLGEGLYAGKLLAHLVTVQSGTKLSTRAIGWAGWVWLGFCSLATIGGNPGRMSARGCNRRPLWSEITPSIANVGGHVVSPLLLTCQRERVTADWLSLPAPLLQQPTVSKAPKLVSRASQPRQSRARPLQSTLSL